MAALSCLRRLDTDALHQQSMLASLLRCGAQARMEALETSPCLRFELLRQGGSVVCRVDANRWASRHLPELAGMDWSSVPTSLLDGLIANGAPVDLGHTSLDYVHARLLPRPNGVTPAQLPALDAAEGVVWIERIDGALPCATEERLPEGLALPVTVSVASTTLAWNRLTRLRSGDLLLLPVVAPSLACGRHRLFSGAIDFDKETFTMSDSSPLPSPSQDVSPALDIASVPLRLDVCFTGIELTVAELSRLRRDSVLSLPAQAATKMKICHNGRCIATGELVQVGDVLSVQLTQAPRLA